jgi:hypothetical protein
MIVATRDAEHEVVHVESAEDDEIEFIDSYFPPTTAALQVLDMGRIVIDGSDVGHFVHSARKAGFVVEVG